MRISDWSSDVCSSDLDDIISVDNTRKLAKAVEKAGGPVETLIYPKLSHDMAINAFASLFSDRYDVLKQVSDFIRRKSSGQVTRSEEHTSELQSLMRISYAVFCL